jgi:HAD superfamily hydrolase (TIGR01662 family)
VAIRAVVFDVGETLVDETRAWSTWADWAGVPRLTFLAVLGAVIERGGDHLEPFHILRPDMDVRAEAAARRAAGEDDGVDAGDLYPDAVPCLAALHRAGYVLAIVGNQPSRTEALFHQLDVPMAFVASSATWGVQKPDAAFFERIASELDMPPEDIAYVGDRLDNDIRPAAAIGMQAIFVRRGPWAWIQAGRSQPPEAALTIESLEELPAALRERRAAARGA